VLGLINSLKIFKREAPIQYIKDGLKLYMPYKKNDTVQFVGTGSTSFDGTNDYIACGSDSSLDNIFAGGGTVSAWIKANGWGESDTGRIASKSNSNDIGWNIFIELGGSRLYLRSDWSTTDMLRYASSAITLGQWHHIAITYDSTASAGTDPVIYVDGVSQTLSGTASEGTVVDDAGSNLEIGHRAGGDDREWDGSIKNCAIWNRALTATEVQNVMYKQYNEIPTSSRLTDGLVSWWALDATSLGSELVSDVDTYDASALSSTWQGGSGATISLVDGIGGRDNVLKVLCDGSDDENAETTQAISLTTGKAYQLSFDFYVPRGQTVTGVSVYARNGGSAGSPSSFETHITPTANTWTSKTISFVPTGTTDDIRFLVSDGSGATSDDKNSFYLDNVSFKEVQIEDLKGSNEGSIYGATIDTDVYGSDTPVKPRAIDNAPTVQADAIGAGSASFDGADDYIACGTGIGDTIGDNYNGALTVSMWFKADVVAGDDGFFGIGGFAGNGEFDIMMMGSVIYGGLNAFGWRQYFAFTDTTSWHHLAVVADIAGGESACSMYLDGVKKSTSTAGSFPSASDMDFNGLETRFGQYGNTAQSYFFDGNICQVGIWDAVLTQAQIQSIMEKTYEELTASEKEDLVSYWALDETIESSGSGASVVYDKVDTTLGSDVITNGSMELDSDWISVGSVTTNEQSKTQKYSGSYSRRMVTADSGWTGIKATGISVTQGAVYKLTYYIYGVSGTSVYIGFYSTGGWATKADGSAFENSEETFTNGSWTEKIIYFKPTGTGNVTDGQLQFRRLASVVEVYIDNVSLEKIGGNHGILI